MEYHARLVPVSGLKLHEQIVEDRVSYLIEQITNAGTFTTPIMVGKTYHGADINVILDGHHRFAAAQQLGFERIPAYLLDYGSSEIEVSAWPDSALAKEKLFSEQIKARVVDCVMRDELFPPKSTKHEIKDFTPIESGYPLGVLMPQAIEA